MGYAELVIDVTVKQLHLDYEIAPVLPMMMSICLPFDQQSVYLLHFQHTDQKQNETFCTR